MKSFKEIHKKLKPIPFEKDDRNFMGNYLKYLGDNKIKFRFDPRLKEYIKKKKRYKDNNIKPCISLEKEYMITKDDISKIKAFFKGNQKLRCSDNQDNSCSEKPYFPSSTFDHDKNSGPGYNDFAAAKKIYATIELENNETIKGRIAYDLDETYDIEMIEGEDDEVEYNIPIRNITSIENLNAFFNFVVIKKFLAFHFIFSGKLSCFFTHLLHFITLNL